MPSECPRAKSDMTPCVLKDGDMCYAMDWKDDPVCVGCGVGPAITNVPKPADWGQTVLDYYAKHPEAKRHILHRGKGENNDEH